MLDLPNLVKIKRRFCPVLYMLVQIASLYSPQNVSFSISYFMYESLTFLSHVGYDRCVSFEIVDTLSRTVLRIDYRCDQVRRDRALLTYITFTLSAHLWLLTAKEISDEPVQITAAIALIHTPKVIFSLNSILDRTRQDDMILCSLSRILRSVE